MIRLDLNSDTVCDVLIQTRNCLKQCVCLTRAEYNDITESCRRIIMNTTHISERIYAAQILTLAQSKPIL